MTKKVLVLLLAALLSFALLGTLMACDSPVEDGEGGKLEYTLAEGGDTYAVTGIGSYKGKQVAIESEYNGKPVTAIGDYAFMNCEMSSVTVPEGVTHIGDAAFFACTALSEITLPDSVTHIGAAAFGSCERLGSIALPDDVAYIGGGAFADTAYFADGANLTEGVLYVGRHLVAANGTVAEDYTVKEGTAYICGNAFYENTALAAITLPSGVVRIGAAAFFGCSQLSSITFEGTRAEWEAIEKEAEWDDGTGAYTVFCTDDGTPGLEYAPSEDGVSYLLSELGTAEGENIVIAGTYEGLPVTAVGAYALYGCDQLFSVTLPRGVTHIAEGAFAACENLTSIVYLGTVEEWNAVSKDAFWDEDTGDYTVVCLDGTAAK